MAALAEAVDGEARWLADAEAVEITIEALEPAAAQPLLAPLEQYVTERKAPT